MNQSKFIFLRHAESAYNLAAREAVNSANEVTNFKLESLKVKQDETLIDCGLTEFGIQQCYDSIQKFSSMKIDLILVSPLRRAIQTAYYIFKDHPNKPKLVVVPFLREMLSSSCDIGGNLSNTMIEYPEFDYTHVLTSESLQKYPNLWTLEYLQNQEQQILLKEYIDKHNLNEEEINSRGPKLILNYLNQFPPDSVVETFMDTKNRIQKAKQQLQLYGDQMTVCVTHSRFLQTVSANNFDEDGKPIDGTWIKNCDYINLHI